MDKVMPEPDEFGRVLDEERSRNSRLIALARFVAASAILALSVAFSTFSPDFIGANHPALVTYVLAAGAIVWARRRSPRVARLHTLTIPLLDMPMVFMLLYFSAQRLHAAGVHSDAAALPFQGTIFFALLILLASLSLEMWQIYLAAAVAMVLQTVLFILERPDFLFLNMQCVLTLGFTAALCAYARSRTVSLVDAVARQNLERERLSRYFSPQVAKHLEQQPESFGAGEIREVTVLFADIRDFTALAERLESKAVVATLNEFLAEMVDVLFAFGGTLDKYMGDGIMAYFGAPVSHPDHAGQAVRCALAMQRRLGQLNRTRAQRGEPGLRMGIGVHTGEAVLGDIGAPRRREYTIIGDTVNVAARIEQLTKLLGVPILVSEETRRQVQGIEFTPAEALPVKGKSEPIRTHVPQPCDESDTSDRAAVR